MPRVLVVDDEPVVRRVISLALELDDFEVATAVDGADAITQAEKFNPDVVIMDIMMPRVDGLTALSHMRQEPSTADLPILLLSAKANSVDITVGMRAGADDYLTKPFEVDNLLKRVRAMLDMAPEQRPHRRVAAIAAENAELLSKAPKEARRDQE